MASTVTPHFDLPFRFLANGTTAVVEQDSYPDVANCVEVIVRTPYGFRNDSPEFGIPDSLLFNNQPVLTAEFEEIIANQEPRAVLVFTEQPDLVDSLIDRVKIQVS